MRDVNFGQQIFNRRKELKLSLRELSRLSGIAASTISRVENGRFSPTLDNAVRLAAALRIELADQRGNSNVEAPQIEPSASRLLEDARAGGSPVTYNEIAITILKAGIRRNLSKIAARGSYRQMLVVRGSAQMRANDGFRANLKPGAMVDCRAIALQTYFAVASEDAELLWIR
ncbi:helix-turn-helix domain-containing protein [Microvirga arsenatis]|uniref:Helix-turn-helix domain-containing protein n=1 Tax=Microvirga arsenatis TaxID=2692265 RepID=A0ABW9Z302_9HYPH|nr:helix-turn-helix domain-containing protein [Microvirga arsenatis]NBJ27068.1 helix-turn-helix domain-containing protein [Microvirga arsenatis]